MNADTGETDQRVEVLNSLSGKIGDVYDEECNQNDSKFYENCEFTRRSLWKWLLHKLKQINVEEP